MKGKFVEIYRGRLKDYLDSLVLKNLRAYGRYKGVSNSTEKKKSKLIDDIIGVLVGEIPPQKPSTRGAPVKNDFVDPKIEENIARIRKECENVSSATKGLPAFDEMVKDLGQFYSPDGQVLRFESPLAESKGQAGCVYRGQIQTLNGIACLLPTDCIEENSQKIFLPTELIREHDLREGDIISCHARKGENALIVCEVLSVNDIFEQMPRRLQFETAEVGFPKTPIRFLGEGVAATPLHKYLEWVTPVFKGQRGLLISTPKAGKTTTLYNMVKSLGQTDSTVLPLVLLIDQSPEVVGAFRSAVHAENVIYSTYEDESDKQVFTAEFLLKRAKRMAETGRDVVLFVDGFNALARAYNETEESEGGKVLEGGLESKTVHYLKKFFGAARKLNKGGSLTIIGTLSCDTGNPSDDLLVRELTALSNLQLYLDEKLSLKRVYPAIDALHSRTSLGGFDMQTADTFLQTEFLPRFDSEGLSSLLSQANSIEELYALARQKLQQ